MIRVIDNDEKYEAILDRSTPRLMAAIESIARAYLAGKDRTAAIARLAQIIGKDLVLAELLGRESTAQVARHIEKQPSLTAQFRDQPAEIVPRTPFTEALEEIELRTPEVARYTTPEYIGGIIRNGGFTLARSSDQLIIERTLKAIADLAEAGANPDDAALVIAEIGDWSRAYGDTVYRTNIARMFSGGRMMQAEDEDAREAIPAFRYSAIRDDAVRENHWAADGLVAPVGHPLWTRFKPPLGFRCRCGLDFVDVYDYEYMKKKGMLRGGVAYPRNFNKAGADPGFMVA